MGVACKCEAATRRLIGDAHPSTTVIGRKRKKEEGYHVRQRMGKEMFAMIERTRCASAQVARWCGLVVGAAILAFALKPHAATFTYTNPACTTFTVTGTPPTQLVTCVTSGGGGGGGVPTCSPTADPGTTVGLGTQVTNLHRLSL